MHVKDSKDTHGSRGVRDSRENGSGFSRPPVDVSDDVKEQLAKFLPGDRVRLKGLIMNSTLNGFIGTVLAPQATTSPEVAGTAKVQLENGREVAVKPINLEHVSPLQRVIEAAEKIEESRTGGQITAPLSALLRADQANGNSLQATPNVQVPKAMPMALAPGAVVRAASATMFPPQPRFGALPPQPLFE